MDYKKLTVGTKNGKIINLEPEAKKTYIKNKTRQERIMEQETMKRKIFPPKVLEEIEKYKKYWTK